MTAEIAILNRHAVAMAADSAVTLRNPEASKVYNTANKLFMLSKYKPVGVMVFGSAELMMVPWETIIKTYRAELGKRGFDHLEQYADDFLRFFHRENLLFPEALQEQNLHWYLTFHLTEIKEAILENIRKHIESSGPIADSDVPSLVQQSIAPVLAHIAEVEHLPSFGPTSNRGNN